MRIVFGLGMCAAVLVAAPASAEICSKIGTQVFDARVVMTPVNQPEAGQDFDALTLKGERDADRMLEQIMRRNDPLVVERPDAAAQGWPCLRKPAVRVKDEIARQRASERQDDASNAASAAVQVGRGIARAMQTVAREASDAATRHSVVQDRLIRFKDETGKAEKLGSSLVHAAYSQGVQSKMDALNSALDAHSRELDRMETKEALRSSLR